MFWSHSIKAVTIKKYPNLYYLTNMSNVITLGKFQPKIRLSKNLHFYVLYVKIFKTLCQNGNNNKIYDWKLPSFTFNTIQLYRIKILLTQIITHDHHPLTDYAPSWPK